MSAAADMVDTSGSVLLGYQQRWLADSARVKVMAKSRRIGITWSTGSDCVLEAGSRDGQDIWYVSYNEDSAKEFIRDCAKWCRWLGIAAHDLGLVLLEDDEDGDLKGVRAFQITFPHTGFRITALTSTPRNIRGKQGRVIIDEAAFHDDLKSVLKAALALLMWGGEVWVMSSHNGVENEFNVLCEAIADGKRPYSLHTVTIEDAMADGLYERIATVLGLPMTPDAKAQWLKDLEAEYGDGVREELYCEPSRGGQSYIGRPLVEAVMFDAPVIRLTRDDAWILIDQEVRTAEIAEWCDAVLAPLLSALPEALPHAFGWDFGRYSDRSVLAPLTLEQNLVRRARFLLEMENIPHNDQWQVMLYIGERLPNLFAAWLDAGGNGAWISEQAFTHWGDGIVNQVDLSVKFYAEHMPAFREAHERGTIAYPRDLDVRNDITLIRRVDGVPRIPPDKTVSKSGGKKRHGDAALALWLGYLAASQADAANRRWEALSMPLQRGGSPWAY
jgi:phage FluMu gp28-like protein